MIHKTVAMAFLVYLSQVSLGCGVFGISSTSRDQGSDFQKKDLYYEIGKCLGLDKISSLEEELVVRKSGDFVDNKLLPEIFVDDILNVIESHPSSDIQCAIDLLVAHIDAQVFLLDTDDGLGDFRRIEAISISLARIDAEFGQTKRGLGFLFSNLYHDDKEIRHSVQVMLLSLLEGGLNNESEKLIVEALIEYHRESAFD